MHRQGEDSSQEYSAAIVEHGEEGGPRSVPDVRNDLSAKVTTTDEEEGQTAMELDQ